MSSRSMSQPPASSHAESDLDSTAELPVLDPARVPSAAADEAHARTDTWVLPAPPRIAAPSAADRDAARPLEANLQSVSAALQAVTTQLREAQELLANRGERVTQLEHLRDEAHAALAAAEQRVAALSAELAQRQAVAAQHALQLDESSRARATAEQRATTVGTELVEARALLSAGGERAAVLQRRLEEQESESRALREQELEQQRALAVQDRAHTAGVMEDLHYERARAMSFLESLHSLEARRQIAEALVIDLHHETQSRAADLGRLTRDLAAREGELGEREGELAHRAARIARLEQQVSSLTATLAQRDTQLGEARQEVEGLKASVARLQGELAAGGERQHALEQQLEQNHSAVSQQLAELQRLRAERSELNAALESTRTAAAATAEAAATRGTSQGTQLAQQRALASQLEAALAAERQRATELESELTTVRTEMEDWGGVLRSAQQERGGHLASIAAAERRVQALEQEVADQRAAVHAVRAERDAHAGRSRELEAQLQAAAATVERLEADARSHGTRIEELERSNQQWRTTVEETRHVLAETAVNPILRDAPRHLLDEGAMAEAPPEGATRLLIQSESGREIVHVLGRKTSIGRTPDNDLQIEAKFISRHHAVILAGSSQTIIEDLNSTNGVQVNGRRVTRHTLKDGDQIAIGRTQYRFTVRKGTDKR